MHHGRYALLASLALLALTPAALAQRSGVVNPNDSKKALGIIEAFKPVVRAATKSTVQVRAQKEGVLQRVALGTIVSPDGYILTKGSEILDYSMITVQVDNDGSVQELDAKVVGYNEPIDIAMIKISAKGLTPAVFADTRPPIAPETKPVEAGPVPPRPVATRPATQPAFNADGTPARPPRRQFNRDNGGVLPVVAALPIVPDGAVRVDVGEWVATTEAGGTFGGDLYPRSVGVISTPRRAIERIPGYLGISWLADSYDGSAARIMTIIQGSNAQRAGIKNDDYVTAINGIATPNSLKMREVLQSRSRGDTVTLNILRDGKPLTIRAQLGGDPDPDQEEVETMVLSGQVNRRSGDFPAVFQHDTEINPADCGGPLVDLEGRVIGINIARAGRTESYAIPADLIVPLIAPMKAGKMPPPSDTQTR